MPGCLDTSGLVRLAAAAALGVCPGVAHALYGGYEHELRDFGIGSDYFLDLAPIEASWATRDIWAEDALRPGGARGYRFAYGSTSAADAWFDHELALRYELDPPWTWRFRYFEGESPEGRYRHVWTGMEAALGRGWSAYFFGEPLGAKENADLGLSLRRERPEPGDAEHVRWAFELRAIWPDLFYNEKNSIDARHENTPFDLQLSARWALRGGGWLALDADRASSSTSSTSAARSASSSRRSDGTLGSYLAPRQNAE